MSSRAPWPWRLAACLILALAAIPALARAEAGPWGSGPHTKARLVSAVTATGDLASLPLGLEVELDPGWKTYWRSPGDAGLPPGLTFKGPIRENGWQLSYPAPMRFSLFGLETFGYHDTVLFPLTVEPARPGAPLALSVDVNLLVCAEICIPVDLPLSIDLPAGPATPSADAQRLAIWRARVPGNGRMAGLAINSVAVGADALTVNLSSSDGTFRTPDVIVEAPSGWAFGPPERQLAADGRQATLRLPYTGRPDAGASLAGAALTLTVTDGDRAMEEAVTAGASGGAAAPMAAGALAPAGLFSMLLVALLGGFILNFMPCVLPVLSLKVASLARLQGAAPAKVRSGFLATAAGIIVSFLALGAGLAGLKSAGAAIGWGIQFQQPLFLAFMAVVVSLFACNLAGFFEILLPRRIVDAVSGPLPVTGREPGLAGSFAAGVFATLLATPCSAPFLGTALGFALSRGWSEIMAIFAVLGIGLALPYLAVAAVPAVARLLPRPGAWMLWLKRVLALALAGTALWLLSVLASQIGFLPVLLAGGLLVLGAILFALARRRQRLALPALLAMLAILPLAFFAASGDRGANAPAQGGPWLPFSTEAVAGDVAAGKVVLVDVTADWCLTCKVNRKLVLDAQPIAGLLASGAVTGRLADWTNPDDGIAAYLASFGRYGIPFYAVYGPSAPQGIALPELVTAETIQQALAKAR
ncbi:protein-disulfide reductase DsbD family protein [Radicibacter daui]|uniref:protein-disulfide reductase DsbD family protein n=1 Tax=Radicibacter daui TaxID=3064829 RepID=UPI0040469150